MEFPADIKGCMKDCILSLIWPKADVYSFLAQHGCTKKELGAINDYREAGLSRSEMIDRVFASLMLREDKGLGVFRSMLHSLLNWSHFDSYYFDQLKKLDRGKAVHNLEHLRQLQEIRDARINKDRREREVREKAAQQPQKALSSLLSEYLDLHSGRVNPQTRGYALEKILLGLAKLDSLDVTESFRVSAEQIDGAIKYDGENYILEAKWQEKEAGNECVYQFAAKVEGKMYGRGIFISVNGFSAGVVGDLVKGKVVKTVLVDGEDIVLVLENHISFRQMLDKKVKAAQIRGHIYIHPITGKEKHLHG